MAISPYLCSAMRFSAFEVEVASDSDKTFNLSTCIGLNQTSLITLDNNSVTFSQGTWHVEIKIQTEISSAHGIFNVPNFVICGWFMELFMDLKHSKNVDEIMMKLTVLKFKKLHDDIVFTFRKEQEYLNQKQHKNYKNTLLQTFK